MFGNLTPMVRNLLMINVGVFLIQYLVGVDFPKIFGLRYFFSSQFEPYQIFAHFFVHGGGWHLFSNMFGLFIFGPLLERFWGSNRFLVFYLVTAIGASMLYSAIHFYEVRQIEVAALEYASNPNPEAFSAFVQEHVSYAYSQWYDFIEDYSDNPENPVYVQESVTRANYVYELLANRPMVGASGAIFGILMAFGYLFPNTTLMLLIPPIPIKAKYFVLFYGLYTLYAGIQNAPGDNVAHFAHLGGMLFAFILLKIWGSKRDKFY